MNEPMDQDQIIAADIEAARLTWGKLHHKTPEQMEHLTAEELAECYLLARDYAMMRRWKVVKAEDQGRRPRDD
jgi:hypothetical protein